MVKSGRWLDWLLPAVCVVCGDALSASDGLVCGLCWARAPRQRYPLCGRCGISLQDTGIMSPVSSCIECQSWLPYLVRARAPFLMDGTAAEIVHALKYGRWEGLAEEMAERMAMMRFDLSPESKIGGVVAVPLSRARLRERGFNQAELLAWALALRRGWPVLEGALVRTRHTRRQARLASGQRLANVTGAFAVPIAARSSIAESHLLLVDDVLTTAATVQDCVRALCGGGARAVSVVTFARARPSLPRAVP